MGRRGFHVQNRELRCGHSELLLLPLFEGARGRRKPMNGAGELLSFVVLDLEGIAVLC